MSLGNWAQFVGRGTKAIDFRVENKWRAWVSIDSSHERTTILSPKVMVTVENISDQFPSNCFYSFTFEDLKANCQNGFQRRRIVFVIRVNNRRRKIKTNNHHKGFRFHLETGDVILVTMTTTLFFFLLFIYLFSLSLSLCFHAFACSRNCAVADFVFTAHHGKSQVGKLLQLLSILTRSEIDLLLGSFKE